MTIVTNAVADPQASARNFDALFAPAGIAIIGASERSRWTRGVLDNAEQFEYPGKLHLVNRNGSTVFGRESVQSGAEIEGEVDLAVVMVSRDAVPSALHEAAAAGARAAIVIAAGYTEGGAAGAVAQSELLALAGELGIRVLGPNCLGSINVLDRTPTWVTTLPSDLRPGPIAVVAQSGNVGATVASFAARHRIGLSHIVSTGNEVGTDSSEVVLDLLEDDRVGVVAMFVEGLRRPADFLVGARRALELQKPIVMLKAGVSSLGQALTQTHTGALAGNDSSIRAALDDLGVIRVSSLEELMVTSAALDRFGVLSPGGLGVVTISGGVNDLVADRADALGLSLPPFAASTREAITVEVPDAHTVHNPYDLTAAPGREAWAPIIRSVIDDPAIAVTAIGGFTSAGHEVLGSVAETMRELDRDLERVFVLVNALEPLDRAHDAFLGENAPHIMTGVDTSLAAVDHAIRWSALARRGVAQVDTIIEPPVASPESHGEWSEVQATSWLAQNGVPTVPFEIAHDVESAKAAASRIGYPVVAKLVSPAVRHKSDIGGVLLNLVSDDEVEQAYHRVLDAARTAGVDDAAVMISPMRRGGLEVIVGVKRDPDWGLLLLVGLGGVFAEVFQDVVVRRLPASSDDVLGMLAKLKSAKLFDGYRGTPPIDRRALADVIARFGQIACAAGDQLEGMEINPLRVDGDQIEALDALVVWRP